MIEVLKKIWHFAGKEQKNISKSIFWGFFYAVFHMFQVGAIYYVVLALTGGDHSYQAAWTALALLLVSIAGRAAINRFTQLQQTHAGYFMVADRRIRIGDKLKRIPMGYFNDKSLGEITGITTTVLDVVETMGPVVLVSMLSGFINALVFILCVFFFDWRIGLLALAGTILYLCVTSAMERRSAQVTPHRQESEARLVDAVLEQIQGMSVIKSFNLTGKGDKRVRDALEYNRESNLNIERLFTPYNIAQEMSLHLFSVLIIGAAVLFCLNGSMSLANALTTVIISFLIFSQIQSAGSAAAGLRVVGSSIDHADQINGIREMDDKGKEIHPQRHDISMEHVDFSYDSKPILKNVSVTIPDRTTTAIVGPSGSGKTTLCNLIARFWDVDHGSIRIGDADVREYTLESLMEQISMVFQKVYLFADTIENNIKFGRPYATHEQVVEAARKACCHEFIEALPDGYNTVIGEGGATLSGGEKQRISIARAILKDSPIIIFDEATANVDPENEDKLQKAMEELMRDKTIIMIAHRLKTVQKADQILVLDDGAIVQRGTHAQLSEKPGLYRDFLNARKEAAGWKLS
ncbi:MAG TPA: ABC transporter ATP-binding protein/permease [Candidatus Mediterraneibacter vanvlietii]|nr:ABC transporter ATP-binding protein/permease [Candidatus Mediterraneibacter vanvlietii]